MCDTLHRGHTVISNPRNHRVLEVGDRLLCFGKLESMRDLVPERRRHDRPAVKELELSDGATAAERSVASRAAQDLKAGADDETPVAPAAAPVRGEAVDEEG